VIPGSYTVVETDLAGYTSTLPADNTDAVTVIAGGTATALFYDTQKTAISGNVRLDLNGNGIVDTADTNGIAAVTVTLKQGSTVVATTTTSASGAYSFTNVLPGAYTLVETDLAGYSSTLPVNNTLAVTLVSGTASTGNNFYDTLPGTVRGSVLVDLNGDGVADAVDTNAIAGVTVTLKQGSTVIGTTTTDAQGGYTFTNIQPGSYTVVETDLAGYTSTLPADNTDAITVTAGGTATALFYDTQKTAISGNVRLDVNGNGIVDTADTNGIAAVTVTLKQGSTVVATTTTSASGVYSFTNVMPGAYTIIESDLSGYTSTLPVNNTLAVTLVSGTASTGNNFYDTLPGTVRGSVLVDLNGDGVADAVDTNAISGVTVTLKQGSTVIGTTTTDAQGGYTFTNVIPGAYTVVETDLAGYTSTLPADNTDAITVTAGGTATALFYDTQKTAISGNVRLDLNGNGLVDTADTNGIAAVTVTLKQGSTVVATTTTSASGAYSFTNVLPGAYTLVETDLAGYSSTLPVNNTLAVTLVSGTASTGNNFYDTLPGTVRGSVLVDLNGDGVADAVDTNAISGVTVTLKQGSTVIGTTTTDAQGGYTFTNVIPGAYTVVETDLAGYTSTLPADNTDAVTVIAGGTATALFYDTQKTAISGNVRLDLNGNGLVDTADTNGIAAVTVTLKQGSTVVATTTTSASGAYSFTNVLPGAYTLVETDLAGYTSTLPVNNMLAVTLVSGTASSGNNFYDTLPGTVRGSVLVDLNGDGVVNAVDTNAIAGVTVTLKQGSTVIGTTTTDAQGGYTFTNVIPGAYTVVETDLAGYTSTLPADNTDAVTVIAGGTATALFYDTQKTAISGNVRLDLNGNGLVDTGDTNGIAAVTVTLKSGSTVVATTTTSASGAYSFTNVMPGAYTIVESDLAGYTSTLPVNNTLAVTLVSGTASSGNNFYDTLPGTVRGSVLVDLNGDGVVNAVDTNAIAGVTVTLKQGSNGGSDHDDRCPGRVQLYERDTGQLHGGGDRSGGLYQHAAGG
jgi:protocatechuate 3,4-dioxygenase beta subunit